MWKSILHTALDEDRAASDVTTQGLGISGSGRFALWAKDSGLWVGQELLEAVADHVRVSWHPELPDAAVLRAKTLVGYLEGDGAAILKVERSVLNLLSYVSGIAAETRAVVARVSELAHTRAMKPPLVLATRKTHPGLRDVALWAVRKGGAEVHRRDLSSAVLVKDNHLKILGGLKQLQGPEFLDGAWVEVAGPEDLSVLASVRGAERLAGVLLDNMRGARLEAALQWLAHARLTWQVEVSGGVELWNLEEVVLPGVDRISIGALTHTVKAFDFSLKAV